MRRTWQLTVALLGAAIVLSGCGSATSTEPHLPPGSHLPADSPLAGCVDPTPAMPSPVDAPVAQDFSGGRVRTTLSLDDGAFQAAPAPGDAAPKISAALAFCNLLAGVTASNFSVLGVAEQHGLSFGLGVVTVSDSVLMAGPRTYSVGNGAQQTVSLQPYHGRLAWIAVITPESPSSCPAARPPASPQPTTSPEPILPGYQILAVDANTGTDGILYSTKTNATCGGPGFQPASVAPAVELVSVPWTLVKRDAGGSQSATISYQARTCDLPSLGYDMGTDQPVVTTTDADPGLVTVTLERVVETCGTAPADQALLRREYPTKVLPQRLVHAPTGAEDVRVPGVE